MGVTWTLVIAAALQLGLQGALAGGLVQGHLNIKRRYQTCQRLGCEILDCCNIRGNGRAGNRLESKHSSVVCVASLRVDKQPRYRCSDWQSGQDFDIEELPLWVEFQEVQLARVVDLQIHRRKCQV